MAKFALVVMSEPGDEHPGGQGRMLHAMMAAKDLRAQGHDVGMWFHGVGVTWLTAFDERADRYTQNYGPLFDEIRECIGGACGFCALTRFGAGASAEKLGVAVVGGPDNHHSLAPLIASGYQVFTF
jgi:DsrE/DsrF-like family